MARMGYTDLAASAGATAAIPVLKQMLTDPNAPFLRLPAATALRRLGDPSGDSILQQALNSPLNDARLIAARALAQTGLAIGQAACPGAPIIFGGSPSSFDMRKGTTPMGAMETIMIDMAYTQIGKRLKLPTHAYIGLSDAKINDAQAGFETGIGAVLAALAGINVISGAGMMDYETTISLEKLLIDDEICGQALRLIRGIAQREDPIALHLFEDFDPATQFLKLAHTRKWYRLEHSFPRLADRDNYDAWVAAGRKSIADRAHEEALRILKTTPPRFPEAGLRKEILAVMRADAQANGADRLPLFEGI